MKVKKRIAKIKVAMKSKAKDDDEPVASSDLLSLGSVLLNLGMTGRTKGGIAKEDYCLMVGDSMAGKTWIGLTTLAEAANNKNFDKYTLIYDNIENGAKMDFEKFWGKKMKQRVMPPRGTRRDPEFSSTVLEFYFNLDDALNKGPCVYVLDSMDALEPDDDIEQFEKDKTAFRKGRETSGSYDMSKQKKNSKYIKRIIRKLRKTGSILIIIAQTRDKIGSHIPNQKTRGGGHSLKFYAHNEIWLSKKMDIDKNIGLSNAGEKKKTKEQQGIIAKIKVVKSRHTGREKTIEVPIYWSAGVDDTGSCVDYLVDKGYWSKQKGLINAKEFQAKMKREQLVHHIEEEGGEKELHQLVTKVWRELDNQLRIIRKPRYA